MHQIYKSFAKPASLSIILFLFFIHGLFAESPEVSRLRSRVKQGDQEAKNAIEIIHQAETLKMRYELRPLLENYGGFGTSIQIDISGTDTDPEKTDINLLVTFPLYSEAAVHLGLSVLNQLANHLPSRPLRVAFLADETEGYRGLQDQLDQSDDPESVVILYLDVISEQGPLYLYQGSQKHISPRQLVEQVLLMGAKYKIPVEIPQPYSELYRLGWVSAPEALEMIQNRGFPALYFSDFIQGTISEPFSEHSNSEYAQQLSVFFKALIDNCPRSPALFDYHYSLIAFNKNYVLVDERTTLLLIVSSIFIIILFLTIYSIVFRRTIIHHWIVFIRRSWVILVYYGLLIISFYGSRFVFKLWQLRNGPGAQIPLEMAFVFLLVWFSLFSLLSPLTQKIVIPKRSSFYGHSAIVVLLLGLLTSTAIDISFMPVFIWALLWVFVGSFVHSFSLSLFSTILAPVQLLILFIIGTMKGKRLTFLLLLDSSHLGNCLLFSFIILPFVLLWKRTSLLRIQKSGIKNQQKHFFIGRFVFAGAAVIALLTLTPPSQITQNLETDKAATLTEKPQFHGALSTNVFLNQRSVKVTITATSPLDLYIISLENPHADKTIQLIESTIPFSVQGTDKLVSNLSKNPDNPFSFELLLPKDEQLKIGITGIRGAESTEQMFSVP